MNPADKPPAVHPSPIISPALMRGLCEQIEHDLSELAWLLAGQPSALPPGSIHQLLELSETINKIRTQL